MISRQGTVRFENQEAAHFSIEFSSHNIRALTKAQYPNLLRDSCSIHWCHSSSQDCFSDAESQVKTLVGNLRNTPLRRHIGILAFRPLSAISKSLLFPE